MSWNEKMTNKNEVKETANTIRQKGINLFRCIRTIFVLCTMKTSWSRRWALHAHKRAQRCKTINTQTMNIWFSHSIVLFMRNYQRCSLLIAFLYFKNLFIICGNLSIVCHCNWWYFALRNVQRSHQRDRRERNKTRNQQITENETKQNKTYERLNAFSTLGLGERYVKYIIHFQVCNFVPRW